MKYKILILKSSLMLLFLSLTQNFLLSNQKDSKEDSLSYYLKPEIVISATRFERNILELPFSISKIKNDEFNQSNNTPDLLKTSTGSWVQKTNLGGGSIFIRGLTGNQSLIMIDGIRLNNSTFRYGPNQYLNTIAATSINNIEVLRGTGSVQYGSDALGGVIYLQTHEPIYSNQGFTTNGFVQSRLMTSNIEKTINAGANFAFEKSALLLGFNYSDFGDLLAGGNIGFQRPTGYKQNSIDAKFSINIIDNLKISLSYNNVNQHNVPIFHKVKLENFEFNKMDLQARNLFYFSLNYSEESFLKNANLKTGYTESIENRSRKLNGKDQLIEEKDKIKTFFGTINFNSLLISNINLTYGAEIYYDIVNSTREDFDLSNKLSQTKRGLYPDDSKYLNKAFYILSDIKLGKFIIDLGIRYNSFLIIVKDKTFGLIEIKPSAFVYNAGVVYRLSDEKSIYTSLNTGFRAPNIDDMGTIGIVDFRYEIPSYGLNPEKSLGYEIGFKANEENFHLSASLFNSNLSDFITRVKSSYNGKDSIDGYQIYKKDNVAKSIIYGAELELGFLFDRIDIFANLTYTYGHDITADEPMRRIPPLFGTLVLNYRISNNFSFSLQNLYAGKQNRLASGDKADNRINPDGTPGWYVLNGIINYKINHIDISLGFYNLFNEAYRYHGSGIDALGRSAALFIKFYY